MCTLSIFKLEKGVILFMNRDERHDRASEHPPQLLAPDIYGPKDPQSGGTWIA